MTEVLSKSTGVECLCTVVFISLESAVVLDVQLTCVFANPVGQPCVHWSLLLVTEGGREASGLPAASLLDEGSLSLSLSPHGWSIHHSIPSAWGESAVASCGHRSGGSRDTSGTSSVVLNLLSQAGSP